MNTKTKWEPIAQQKLDNENNGVLFTDRMNVPGGWIVRSAMRDIGGATCVAVAQTFVPDPEHEWKD